MSDAEQDPSVPKKNDGPHQPAPAFISLDRIRVGKAHVGTRGQIDGSPLSSALLRPTFPHIRSRWLHIRRHDRVRNRYKRVGSGGDVRRTSFPPRINLSWNSTLIIPIWFFVEDIQTAFVQRHWQQIHLGCDCLPRRARSKIKTT